MVATCVRVGLTEIADLSVVVCIETCDGKKGLSGGRSRRTGMARSLYGAWASCAVYAHQATMVSTGLRWKDDTV
jgi:hypothetical protein